MATGISTTGCANGHIVAWGPRAHEAALTILPLEAHRQGAAVVAVTEARALDATNAVMGIDQIDILGLQSLVEGHGAAFATLVEAWARRMGGDDLVAHALQVMERHVDAVALRSAPRPSSSYRMALLAAPSQRPEKVVAAIDDMAMELATWSGPPLRVWLKDPTSDKAPKHGPFTVEQARAEVLSGRQVVAEVELACRDIDDLRPYIAMYWLPLYDMHAEELDLQRDRRWVRSEGDDETYLEFCWTYYKTSKGTIASENARDLLNAMAADHALADLMRRMRKELVGTIRPRAWWDGYRVIAASTTTGPILAVVLDDIMHAASVREDTLQRKVLTFDAALLSADPIAGRTLERMMRLGRKYNLEIIVASRDTASRALACHADTTIADADPATHLLHSVLSSGTAGIVAPWYQPADLVAGRRLLSQGAATCAP